MGYTGGMRTLAIGDIHGCSYLLDALLAAASPTPDDLVVFLGDYVDRGPDSRGVLDRVIALGLTHRVVGLRGNHEIMMLRARTDASWYRTWSQCGGLQTLGSYGANPGRTGTLADVPEAHWKFMAETCGDWYETADAVFVHANLAPGVPMEEQAEQMLFWEPLSREKPIHHAGGKLAVCGHAAQKSGEILDLGTAVGIDTFAYGGGRLTCLHVESGHYWQADALGRIHEGDRDGGTP